MCLDFFPTYYLLQYKSHIMQYIEKMYKYELNFKCNNSHWCMFFTYNYKKILEKGNTF